MAEKKIRLTQNELPEDLWVKIFLSQPVKTLMRLRCVCKLWNQIITSNSFTKAHLSHQKTTSPNPNKYYLLNYHYSFLFVPANRDPLTTCRIDLDDTFGVEQDFESLQFYGICDGLLCLSEHPGHWPHSNRGIFLWNPILRKAKKLPQLGPQFRDELPALCFGHYDDDYKVIAVTSSLHICVYSLSIDSWKFLKFSSVGTSDTSYTFNISPYPNTKLVKGIAYFIQKSTTTDARVVAFDLNTQLVRIITLPREFGSPVNYFMEEYKESIALLRRSNKDDVVMMWVLNLSVSDNFFSWDNKCTFQLGGEKLKGFINNDNLVMMNNSVETYDLHNIENGFRQRLTTLEGQGELEEDLESVHYFPESLVLHTESSVNSTSRRNKENTDMVMNIRKLVLFLRS